MGMTLEGEFWEGKMYSPTWNYLTIAHFFLSLTSSAANICLVLAFCDSKLGWVFKYPSAILAAVWCTISYAQYQVLFHGYGTRFLTAQLPFELVTFATAMPGALFGLCIKYEAGSLSCASVLPMFYPILNFAQPLLGVTGHWSLLINNVWLYITVVLIWGHCGKPTPAARMW